MSISLDELKGRSVYIDTNIFIYFLDGQEPFLSIVYPFLESLLNGEIIGYTGDAVVAETMVQPYKLGNLAMIERFKAFFAQDDFLTVLNHDANAFDLAAQLSGTQKMKLVDSLHMATALQAGCDFLITHQKGIKLADGIKVVQLSGIAAPVSH
ncbi:MAG: type II toxin-antitoxin system VapC family toxin [Thiolinea sp.]